MKEIFIKKIEGAHKCIMHDIATQKHKYTHKKGQSYPVSTATVKSQYIITPKISRPDEDSYNAVAGPCNYEPKTIDI